MRGSVIDGLSETVAQIHKGIPTSNFMQIKLNDKISPHMDKYQVL